MLPSRFQHEMIRSELEEVVGEAHIATGEAEKLVYKLFTLVLYYRISFRKGWEYIGFFGDFRL
mgnify:CR=1 FL=1